MVVSAAVAHRIPAGWYRDRDDPARRRWWDGVEWTDYYAPRTQALLTIVEPVAESAAEQLESDAAEQHGRHAGLTVVSRRVPLTVVTTLAVANVVLVTILARMG